MALDRAVSGLADADRRLAHELAAGVLRTQGTLDAALTPLVPRGWEHVYPPVRAILRLGAYQLTQLQRVPAHAAVSTSVELAREVASGKTPAFVNAVLRRIARGEGPPPPAVVPAPHPGPAPAPRPRPSRAPSTGEPGNHPSWLVARWRARFGRADTDRLLRWNDTRPRLVVQPARASLVDLQEAFLAAGIACEPAPFGAGLVVEASRPTDLPGYADGDFVVQDPAQALVVRFAAVPAGATVYDACAAPGGKTIALTRTAGRVVAGEAARARVGRLRENLARAAAGPAWPVAADAAHPPVRPVDAVLLDAPCLGTGTFARHPDARWRVTRDALARLAARQASLLAAAAGVVRPGGLLVYATCSLEPEENADQVDRFLASHAAFRREPGAAVPDELLSPAGDLQLLPQRHGMDGAYAARLRRAGG